MRNALLMLGSLLALAVLTVLIPPLRDALGHAWSGDTEALREDFGGRQGVLTLLVLTQVHSIVFFPTEIVSVAYGYVQDPWIAFPLLLCFWTLSGVLGHAMGRFLGRPVAVKVVGESRIADAEELLERGGIPVLLAARLIPIVPYAVFSYVAGAARVPLWRFTWTSFVGYVPLTALCVTLGSRLEHLSLSDPLLWASVVAVLAMVAVAHPIGKAYRSSATRGASRENT